MDRLYKGYKVWAYNPEDEAGSERKPMCKVGLKDGKLWMIPGNISEEEMRRFLGMRFRGENGEIITKDSDPEAYLYRLLGYFRQNSYLRYRKIEIPETELEDAVVVDGKES
ncbi:MAG: hypothetical protein N3B16_12775 [Candidatus Aminicenantes bacterium]|nr:hypothetical protein [Candidatus Aminicenantes bacterium]